MHTLDIGSINWIKRYSRSISYSFLGILIIVLISSFDKEVDSRIAVQLFFLLIFIFSILMMWGSKITKVSIDSENQNFIYETKNLLSKPKVVIVNINRVRRDLKIINGIVKETYILIVYLDNEELFRLRSDEGIQFNQLTNIADLIEPLNSRK